MHLRTFAVVAVLAFTVPAVVLHSTLAWAQASDAFPRTPDGRPDFTGIYDVATMTPLERPSDFGDRLFLTGEEVASMVEYEEQRNQRDLEPIDPDRAAPPVGGVTLPANSYEEFIYEYACHEGNYALETVLRGARLAEQ